MQAESLSFKNDYWHGSFSAMASPCEILMEVDEEALAQKILNVVQAEALRIEQKFSRYRDDNIIYQINHSQNRPVSVDQETARLIDFATELYQMSDGLFDITSGVLRQAWVFDCSDNIPEREAVNALLSRVGWKKVKWENGIIRLREAMEIDLGGIGKEYAVDRCVLIAKKLTDQSVLVNFGGDLAVSNCRKGNKTWSVGRLISDNEEKNQNKSISLFQLKTGAIATSGDAHRYLKKDGVRYSHVLNPLTGWPVAHAPHTVSVAAPSCVEAGMMSTLAMLHGRQADEFLRKQEVGYWID